MGYNTFKLVPRI